jgi:L-alanine-DL-glutamate epimerase-like enolase superfamily enzyme
MKIKRIDTDLLEMPLAEPYTIAGSTFDRATNVLMRIETDTETTGYGIAAPESSVTGETPSSVLETVHLVIEPVIKNLNPLRPVAVLEKLKKKLPASPSALAMVDMALNDILSKHAGLPLFQMLGGFRTRIKTSITIGIMPLQETLSKAEACVKQGFKALKLKGGRNVDEDVDKIFHIRELVGPSIELRFDANQGYSEVESITFIKKVKQADLKIIEQPTHRHNKEFLGKLSRKAPQAIMADESIINLRDAFRLVRDDLVDMVNIKLMKAGGIYEALQINALARAAGVEVMIGCMDEAELGIAAGLHFALARPNVTFADLDGHLDLLDDPTRGSVRLKNGYLYPSIQPGLGYPH